MFDRPRLQKNAGEEECMQLFSIQIFMLTSQVISDSVELLTLQSELN